MAWITLTALVVIPTTNALWTESALSYFESEPEGKIISCFIIPPEPFPVEEPPLPSDVNQAKPVEPKPKKLAYGDLPTYWELRSRLEEDVGLDVSQAFKTERDWMQNQALENGTWGGIGKTSLLLLAVSGARERTSSGLGYDREMELPLEWVWGSEGAATVTSKSDPASLDPGEFARATWLLGEAWYGTRSPLLKRRLMTAIRYWEDTQLESGGWRLSPSEPGPCDMALAAQVVRGLGDAETLVAEVAPDLPSSILAWLDRISDPVTGAVDCTKANIGSAAQVDPASEPKSLTPSDLVVMTAAALNCRIYLGQTDRAQYPALESSARYLVELLEAKPKLSPSALHEVSYALFHMGGKYRDFWAPELTRRLQLSADSGEPLDLEATALRSLTIQAFHRARTLEEMQIFEEEGRRQKAEREKNPSPDVIGL